MIWSETLWLPHTDSGAGRPDTHTPPHIRSLNAQKKNKKTKKKRGLAASSYEPASSDVPHPSFHPHRPVHLSSVLAATSNRRSVQVQAEPWTESGGTKKGAGVVESGTEWTSFRSSLTLASVGMVRRFGDEGRGGKPCVCVWRQTMQARLRSRASGGGGGWEEELWHGMARYGVVWFGWLCCRRPSPRPLPPVPLWGPSWEGPLFRAGRRTSEWMSKSSGGPLQWRLFVYTSQSRHTSLAAQPTDNLWCPNRRWVCGCPSALSLSASR